MLFFERIKCFVTLGEKLKRLDEDELDKLCLDAKNGNSWFTKETVQVALKGIALFLDEITLTQWVSRYNLEEITAKRVGVIAAGNIPLVGFHDLLSVLISGHYLMLKPSSEDIVLMRFIYSELVKIDDRFQQRFEFVERLNEADAYIATGSDNSARYFQYYFKDKPSVIRSNRSSVAVLTGVESKNELRALGLDIFQYYGLGCRNVSKLFVPQGYKFDFFFEAIQEFEKFGNHHKYRNNYDYNKSIYLVNGEKHLDNGFLLIKESDEMVSPISVLYYETYKNPKEVDFLLKERKDKIQCIVGENHIGFGNSQEPTVEDYADGVDTLAFLQAL